MLYFLLFKIENSALKITIFKGLCVLEWKNNGSRFKGRLMCLRMVLFFAVVKVLKRELGHTFFLIYLV